MVLPHQLEVLKAIEPEVGAFIDDKMNLPAECWQPSDFLPDLSQEDFPETIKALQLRMANLPDTVLVSLAAQIGVLPLSLYYFNQLPLLLQATYLDIVQFVTTVSLDFYLLYLEW
ncbi:MAG: hypothetical protein RJB25_1135 [Bacteroidota bacterium]